jgi:hypothetical protein
LPLMTKGSDKIGSRVCGRLPLNRLPAGDTIASCKTGACNL